MPFSALPTATQCVLLAQLTPYMEVRKPTPARVVWVHELPERVATSGTSLGPDVVVWSQLPMAVQADDEVHETPYSHVDPVPDGPSPVVAVQLVPASVSTSACV